MQNLDQIRAATALSLATKTTKQDVAKLPAMIITNGFLAAAAFADERSNDDQPKRPEMQAAMNGVAGHLANPVHGIAILAGKNSVRAVLAALSGAGATTLDLQRATSEALSFLAYLKRFAAKD